MTQSTVPGAGLRPYRHASRWFFLALMLLALLVSAAPAFAGSDPAASQGLPGPTAPLSCPGNLLVNGDFETGSFNPWYTWGNITQVQSAVVYNGTYAALLNGGNIGQAINVVANVPYQLRWYHRSDDPNCDVLVRIFYYNGSTEVGYFSKYTSGTTWALDTLNGTAPATANNAEFEFINSCDYNFYLDDVCLPSGPVDYGDAPDTGFGTGVGNYNTRASDNGPAHLIVPNLRLGVNAPDNDNGGLQNSPATLDDTTLTPDDEDGVGTLPTVTTGSTSVSLNVSVYNNTPTNATVACWIDFNRNGSFADTGERASTTVNPGASQQTKGLTFTGFAPPSAGTSYLRCRISSTSSEVTNATGVATSGEVEDYQISVPLAVQLAGFEAAAQTDRVLVTWETVSEANNAGFNLYRATSADGERTLLANVPSSAPGATQGAAYSYEDSNVTAGQTYWYWLEDVDLNGAATLHGPVSVVFQAPTAVTLGGYSAGSGAPASVTLWALAITALLAVFAGVTALRRNRTA